jgi:hypothetical protein
MTDRASRPSPRLTLNAASPMIGPSTRGGLVGKLRTIDEFADLWGGIAPNHPTTDQVPRPARASNRPPRSDLRRRCRGLSH